MSSAYIASQNPSPVTSFINTGSPLGFTVAAENQSNQVVTGYTGTVGFTSSDSAAVLPANSTLVSGLGTFSATLQTPGSQTITATDTVTSSITGTTGSIAVRGLVVTSFSTTPGGFVITFNKPFNPSTVALYTEDATSDDSMLVTLNSQVSVRGSLVLNSPTSPTQITFVKTASISPLGTFNPTNGLLAAGNYTVTLRSYSSGNGFQDMLGSALDGTDEGTPGNNYVFTFAVSTPPPAVGIPDFARGPSNTDAVFLPSGIGNGNTFNLIYTNPAMAPSTGTATVTFSTTSATLQTNIQNALNALAQIGTDANGNPNAVVSVLTNGGGGSNVAVTFQNPAFMTATGQLLSSTTSGVTVALQTINVANNIAGDGIPVALSNGQHVTSGSFTLQYNPALLNITGAVSKISGASFTVSTTINSTTSATAVISLSSPSSISTATSAITLGSLVATVPFSALSSYGSQQLLHFSAEQLATTSNSNISVTSQDAVQVLAFFGDVNDTGLPFAEDGAAAVIGEVAGEIPNTVTQTLPGFGTFPDLDPVIIGDVALQGTVNSTDTGAIEPRANRSAFNDPVAARGTGGSGRDLGQRSVPGDLRSLWPGQRGTQQRRRAAQPRRGPQCQPQHSRLGWVAGLGLQLGNGGRGTGGGRRLQQRPQHRRRAHHPDGQPELEQHQLQLQRRRQFFDGGPQSRRHRC